MDFIEAKHVAAREIALALGVPPMLLGIPGDNTYSNYQEATRTFWRSTVLPLVTRTAKSLSCWLVPAFVIPEAAQRPSGTQGPQFAPAEGLELRPDIDSIEALSIEREALWTRVDKATFLTQNEKRAAVGYGPVDGGDALAEKAGFRVDQSRVPAGQTGGGQWVGDGGDGLLHQIARRLPKSPSKPAEPKPLPQGQPAPKTPGGDHGSTPGGHRFTSHGRRQAMDRDFTDERIDAIVQNNARTRVGKVDRDGRKTWEYTDARGNTVVLNEEGDIVTVFSPVPGGRYIPRP
jgi:Phage portal protein